jgi:hypothetical protein
LRPSLSIQKCLVDDRDGRVKFPVSDDKCPPRVRVALAVVTSLLKKYGSESKMAKCELHVATAGVCKWIEGNLEREAQKSRNLVAECLKCKEIPFIQRRKLGG